MRIRVAHQTTYRYAPPAKSIIQALRLTPRNHDGQHIVQWRIDLLDADGQLRALEDSFGNLCHTLSLTGPVSQVAVLVEGEVETIDTAGVVRGTVERFPQDIFLRETDLTIADQGIRDFAETVAADAGVDELSRLHLILDRLHESVAFETGPTQASTTAAEAFALGKGVCQDLSHIFIAAARHIGIPARYVSGYLLRADGVEEQQAGHAWAEAYVAGLGWVGFDPANGFCPSDAHVRVAAALDYLGAAPIRGSRYGGGDESLGVTVKVDAGDDRPAWLRQSQSQGQA
jgi:transglutaminase-like putative cysteine protease